jgi:LysR family transcriptional regulator, glycine cleavage system transcriptional activator
MDAAIRFGTGDWDGCQVDKIFDIYVQPICSPKLLDKTAARMSISDLSDYNWLGYQHLPRLWQQWLDAAGDGEVTTKKKEIELDNVSVAVQAAVDGLGIIPMYRPLADHLLDSGSLVPAHEFMMLKPEAYYFVCPLNYKEHKPTAIFREWLLSEAKSFTEKWNKNHEIKI